MGSLYRSEEMTLCQLFLQSEAAYACVSELGELGLVEFNDLNPTVNAFQRKFVNEVRRCDEMERKLRFLEKEIKRDEIPMLDTGDNPDAPAPREMIDLEAAFEKLENEMKEVNANADALKLNFLELTELKHILRKTQIFFEEAQMDPNMEENAGLLDEDGLNTGQNLRLGFVAGVLLRERLPAFERMLWRACRGNVFLKQSEIDTPLEDPTTGDHVYKSVFIIFFQGEQLKSRVQKICEGFRATLYPCPETPAERREMAIGVMTRIEDLNTVLGQTQDHRHRVLVAAAKNINIWFIKVRKIKAIYLTLNMFNLDVTQKCLIAECWCPVADLDRIQLALRRGTERSGSSVPSILNRMNTDSMPPTYHRTNKFTSGFQAIVDAYGMATYREVNPALFTIITFPFLFSVMFGDAGHAFIMLLFAAWMVICEKSLAAKKIRNETWVIFFGGRYIILLMALFSIYSGFIYNDVFSKSLNIFGSAWHVSKGADVSHSKDYFMNTTEMDKTVYYFGMDPVWQLSLNKISFLDSHKMKISVVFGVTHMLFGLCLSLSNHIYFRKPINILCEFIPQLLFLGLIFGYLVILIIYKWLSYGEALGNAHCAPSLLIGLINMFLFKYPNASCDSNFDAGAPFYSGQQGIQSVLLVVALLCVPIMLFGKPLLLKREHEGKLKKWQVQRSKNPVPVGDVTSDEDIIQFQIQSKEPPKFEMGDVFINQCIHTIEYCLGCISHTASYLRLWALSLAHAELSEVLWSMIFRNGFLFNNFFGVIALTCVFTPWAVITVGVLLAMEGMSAFLHTLRLHWVEFQSKFYKGEGKAFNPFSFAYILEMREAGE